MGSIGYDNLISFLLPGAILTGAATVLLEKFTTNSRAQIMLSELSGSDFSKSAAILLSSALLGALLASIINCCERTLLNRWAANRLDINIRLFHEEWDCYIESLFEKENRYLEKRALFFLFEIRSGFSIIVFFLVWFFTGDSSTFSNVASAVGGGLGLVLIVTAIDSHYQLARWRDRLFRCQAEMNLEK